MGVLLIVPGSQLLVLHPAPIQLGGSFAHLKIDPSVLSPSPFSVGWDAPRASVRR